MSEVALNPSTQSPFELMGGERGVRALVDAFYDHMEFDDFAASIRALHPTSLDESRNKLHWFLCGWLGGPNYYVERFGHPRLRMRHLPFPIASAERDAWLRCMALATQDRQLEPKLAAWFMAQMQNTADWMRNKEG